MAQTSKTPPRVYALKTFGTLALTSEGASSIAQQRQRLALLVVLAASGDRGVTRDQLLAYLWPESAASNARHSLEQLVHATRRALGENVFNGVNPLSLNAEVVTCDFVEFEHALARDAYARAVELYHGPFLDGFFLDDAPGFERWTETERARLAERYVSALRHLAAGAEKSGEHTTAIGWWRRLVDTEPLSSRSALALMRALVGAGDQAAALQHGRLYETLVRQELDSAPDPSIVAYMAALRAGAVDAPMPPARQSVAAAPAPLPPPTSTPAPATVASPEPNAPTAAARPRSRWRLAMAGAAALALASVAWYGTHRASGATLDTNRILIAPFGVTGGDSSAKSLGEGVVELLSPMLTGEGGPVAVDSRTALAAWNRVSDGGVVTAGVARAAARHVGAAKSLIGTLVFTPGRLTLTSSLVDANSGGAQPLASVTGSLETLPALLDGLLAQLLVRHADVPSRTVASLMSQSLPALRAYLDGRAAYRRAHTADAIRSFGRALDIDSTFALAALDLAVASNKLVRQVLCPPPTNTCGFASTIPAYRDATLENDNLAFDRGVVLAWASRDKLGPREQLLLEALRGRHYPENSDARETYEDLRAAVQAAPDRPVTLYLLGLVMMYQGRSIGFSDAIDQAEGLLRQALTLDTAYIAPRARLVDIAAERRDVAALRLTGSEYLALDSAGATADYVRWRVAAGTNDLTSLQSMRARFDALDLTTLKQIVTASQMSGVALEDADRAATLVIRRATDSRERQAALYWANVLATNRGRPHLADSLLRLRHEADTANAAFWRSTTLAAQFNDGDSVAGEASARARARWLAHDTTGKSMLPLSRAVDGFQEATWAWAHGRIAELEALTNWLRRQDAKRMLDVSAMLLATSQKRSDAPLLRARVDSESRSGCCRAPHTINLLLASAYELAGEDSAALDALRRGVDSPGTLAHNLLRQGRLAARLGDPASAIRAFEHYLALRSDPEPRLRPQRDSIRAELNRLMSTQEKR